jgi:hypothetical protein
MAEQLERYGWQEDDLSCRRKNDPAKLEMAARLRRETMLSINAIAARVHLGTSKTANSKLHRPGGRRQTLASTPAISSFRFKNNSS